MQACTPAKASFRTGENRQAMRVAPDARTPTGGIGRRVSRRESKAAAGVTGHPDGNRAQRSFWHAAAAAASARGHHSSRLPLSLSTMLILEAMSPSTRLHEACMARSPPQLSSGNKSSQTTRLRASALHTIP